MNIWRNGYDSVIVVKWSVTCVQVAEENQYLRGKNAECAAQRWTHKGNECEQEVFQMPEWDEYDYCYECSSYGDDYFVNDDGELESYCSQCPNNPSLSDWDD